MEREEGELKWREEGEGRGRVPFSWILDTPLNLHIAIRV